jgi:hypothetical protein
MLIFGFLTPRDTGETDDNQHTNHFSTFKIIVLATMKLLNLAIILAVLPYVAYSHDECVNATVLPSALVFPYYFYLYLRNATENVSDPVLSCGDLTSVGKSNWYSWIPNESAVYYVSVRGLVSEDIGFTLLGLFQGNECDSLKEIGCSDNSNRDTLIGPVKLVAGKKYFIKIGLILEFFSEFYLTISQVPVPPPNDQCVNAITVNPRSDEIIMGTTTDSRTRKVWYKIQNVKQSELGIVISTRFFNEYCGEFTHGITQITLYEGTACGNRKKVDSITISRFCQDEPTKFGFFPSTLSTYYIEVSERSAGLGPNFALSFSNFSAIPPPNEECVDAVVIPSAPIFPYFTSEVNLANITRKPGSDADTSIWYEWSPGTSGLYRFRIRQYFLIVGQYFLVIFEGDTCATAKEIYSMSFQIDQYPTDSQVQLEAGKKYSIQIKISDEELLSIDSYKFFPFVLVVYTSPNDSCTTAVSLNPLTHEVMGDTTFAIATSDSFKRCAGPYDRTTDSGLWYKIENTSNNTLSIFTSLCKNGTSSDHEINVYQGNDCENLQCVGTYYETGECGESTKSVFLASAATTYFIFVAPYRLSISSGKFTLTIEGSPSFLSLIDSQTDTFIEPLGATIDYRSLSTSNLNIQATFNPDIPVSSVRMTLDNPKRTFCENKAPYSVFGDSKGDFYNATIQLGSRLATATPYGQPGCRGPPGITVATNFTVTFCDFDFNAYDTSREWTTDFNTLFCELGTSFPTTLLSANVSAVPCKINIRFRPRCGFDVRSVRMTLRNAVTNKVVHESTTNGTGPFFLFGARISKVKQFETYYRASNRSIAPGSYTLTAAVNGIRHPAIDLYIDNKVPCIDPATDGRSICPTILS